MKLIAISRTEGVEFAALKPHLREEACAVWDLYRGARLREFYLRGDGPGVVLVFEAEGVEDVKSMLANLPLVGRGLIEFDIVPVEPLLSLEALMAETVV